MCAVLAPALSLGLVPASSADPAGDRKKLDANIAQLSTAIEGTSQDLNKAVLDLEHTKAQLPGAVQTLTAANAAQAVADGDNQTMATALAVAEANEAKASDDLGRDALQSQVAQDQIGNLVRNDYQQGGVSGLSNRASGHQRQDFTDRIATMDTVMRIRLATLRGLDTMRAQDQASQSHLLAVRRQVAALKVEAEAALGRATAARQTAETAKTRLDLLYAAQADYEATVATKKATEMTNLTKLQAESDSLMTQLAARAQAARDAAAAAGGAGSGAATEGGAGSGAASAGGAGSGSASASGPPRALRWTAMGIPELSAGRTCVSGVSSPLRPPGLSPWHRLCRQLWLTGLRRGCRRRHHDDSGVAVGWLRQPADHRPRPPTWRRPDDDLQPPDQSCGHRGMWPGARSLPTPVRQGSRQDVTCTLRPVRTVYRSTRDSGCDQRVALGP